MLEVTGLCKSYKAHKVLSEVSLTAAPGDCVGIVGSNGCGKTTFLSILAGAVRADKGSIRFHGREAVGHAKVFYEEAAYVPQENPLIEELSVRDNLSLWYKGSRTRMEEDLESGPAAMLGIREMLKKSVSTLSGGMKKRLSIACALSNHASVLILDEPGAALDLECKADIRRYLEKYRENGGSILLTSHELPELSLCTVMYVLKEGRLRQIENRLGERELIREFQK
ncbi:ABC transporter ATP-binding protein [Clostridiaceae bacterium]|nr:ABC transporter ATP-binding protein [Clostridiaceae bacterium]RKI09063.1 ABC transporter ATP-binding protein [bacterium 1XD21-70]